MQNLEIFGSNESFGISESKNEIVYPGSKSSFDVSSISSYSLSYNKSVVVTKKGEAYGIGDNRKYQISGSIPQKVVDKFTKITFSDNCSVISAVSGDNYTLYLISNDEQSEQNQLAYAHSDMKNEFPIKLQIGELNPVSLFGGCDDCAAIDSKGSIIYISRSFYKSPTKEIKPIFLPSNEKAIDVACCNKFIFAVSINGCLFKSKSDTDLSFTEVSELKETKIVSISGVYNHCFALSEDGKVFVYGDGSFGRVGLGKNINASEFTEITSLNRYKIVAAYAGVFHSLFQTQEGKIIACGENTSGELRLSEDKNERSFL